MFHVHSSVIPGQWAQHRPHLCWLVFYHTTGMKEKPSFTLVVLPPVPVTVRTVSTDTLVSASSIYFTLLVWLIWDTVFLNDGIHSIESSPSMQFECAALSSHNSVIRGGQSTPLQSCFRTHIINFTMPWNTFVLKFISIWNVILASHVTQQINYSL